MDAAHDDRLLHALKGHTEHEESGDLEIARQVDENLTQSCNLTGLLRIFDAKAHVHRRKCQSSSLLQILDGIADVSVFWWLDGSSKNFSGLILIPELDLQNEFLKGTSLHFRLWVLWNRVVVKLLRAESKYKAI